MLEERFVVGMRRFGVLITALGFKLGEIVESEELCCGFEALFSVLGFGGGDTIGLLALCFASNGLVFNVGRNRLYFMPRPGRSKFDTREMLDLITASLFCNT